MAPIDYRNDTTVSTGGYTTIPNSVYYVDNSNLYNKKFSGVQFSDPRYGFNYQGYVFYLQGIIEDLTRKEKQEEAHNASIKRAFHIAEMERILKAREVK